MVCRNNTGRLGFWLHQCVLRNTLVGSKIVVSTSWNHPVDMHTLRVCGCGRKIEAEGSSNMWTETPIGRESGSMWATQHLKEEGVMSRRVSSQITRTKVHWTIHTGLTVVSKQWNTHLSSFEQFSRLLFDSRRTKNLDLQCIPSYENYKSWTPGNCEHPVRSVQPGDWK